MGRKDDVPNWVTVRERNRRKLRFYAAMNSFLYFGPAEIVDEVRPGCIAAGDLVYFRDTWQTVVKVENEGILLRGGALVKNGRAPEGFMVKAPSNHLATFLTLMALAINFGMSLAALFKK